MSKFIKSMAIMIYTMIAGYSSAYVAHVLRGQFFDLVVFIVMFAAIIISTLRR